MAADMLKPCLEIGGLSRIFYDMYTEYIDPKRSFLSRSSSQPSINHLVVTKTPGKTIVVLAGFCHKNT